MQTVQEGLQITKEFTDKLKNLKEIEDKLTLISAEKEAARKEVLELLKKSEIRQFKNEIATISYMERKTISYARPVEEIIADLEKQGCKSYIETIPEHKELSKLFDNDVKDGAFKVDGVEVKITETPLIKFK